MAKQSRKKGSRSRDKADVNAVREAFERREFSPVYFVYGAEEYQKSQLQETLLATALEPHEKDFNLDIVYGNEAEADAALALCYGMPVVAQRRVVIIRDFEKLKGNALFATYAERPNPTAVVMLVCRGKPNMTTNPYRAIKSAAVAVAVEPPRDREMVGWITALARAQGREIDGRAAQMLADVVGTDVQYAVREIDKLTTFAGTRMRLSQEDVIRAAGETREFNVFELQGAVGRADYGAAVGIAERLLRVAANPVGEALKMVAILNAFLTKLWILSECQRSSTSSRELAARVGIPSYYIQEYTASLRYYGGLALERAFSALLAADYELKGGSTRDPRLVVNLMLRRMVPGSDARL